ncbi:thiamine phosphate synthase [Viridibacillus sp. YIM B01967]|uniref:Thiamine-phosphate synthase n=1 Tax=Viridibacillus soli TaxID=2798301 RepID=A0ABS1H5H6_9BACL|nr:thiamine phosphate synthase [Viridibacillus soli]MBK3494668.1 thiamine phosphate synthase [Viridibacillus soli]
MNREQLQLYFIMGSQNTGQRDPLVVLEEALRGGITIFQLREKGADSLTGQDKIQFAKACQALCKKYHVPFIINDDVDLAIALDADGVHVGQEDASANVIRGKIGPKKILGVSTHSLVEVTAAIEDGADYVGIGPIYATTSKSDAKPPAGTALIVQTTTVYPDLPLVGIGGITIDNCQTVIRSGADGISLISAIAAHEEPFVATRQILHVLQQQTKIL